MKVLIGLIALTISCSVYSQDCKSQIKQLTPTSSFKVMSYQGGYIIGQWEMVAQPDKNGEFKTDNIKYEKVLVRLVYDPNYKTYFVFPQNFSAPYNLLWEKDSCSIKRHWFNYEKQWSK